MENLWAWMAGHVPEVYLYPVTFKVVNAQGQGEYFGGLPLKSSVGMI